MLWGELGAVLRGGPRELYAYLFIAGALFLLGMFAMITRRNFFGLLMGVELVLNGAALNFVAFSRFPPPGVAPALRLEGQVFTLFIIVLAAAEAVVALALALVVWQLKRTVDIEHVDDLRL
ncbi:MAG: NADH-quinone oxidoreductase subunit NuoK [Planctomycetes bacterium]|nr:NADH-quinone oxidoreductase subunit NuoK [Planctomycetota bacterium]